MTSLTFSDYKYDGYSQVPPRALNGGLYTGEPFDSLQFKICKPSTWCNISISWRKYKTGKQLYKHDWYFN